MGYLRRRFLPFYKPKAFRAGSYTSSLSFVFTVLGNQDANGLITGLCVGLGALVLLLFASYKFTRGKNYRKRLMQAMRNSVFNANNQVSPDEKKYTLYKAADSLDSPMEKVAEASKQNVTVV